MKSKTVFLCLTALLFTLKAMALLPGSAASTGEWTGGQAVFSSPTVRCESNNNARNYCPADTRGGVRMTRQISGSPCTQGSTWGYDSNQIWVDRGCRAEFRAQQGRVGKEWRSSWLRCHDANNNARNYCPADTRGGVRMTRQISGSPCTQGSTWGYDSNQIWVDRGCRAEFEILPVQSPSAGNTSLTCSSNDMNRRYCAANTQGGV